MKLKVLLSWLENNDYSFSFSGDKEIEISHFSSLKNYKENTITWIKNKENYDRYISGKNVVCAIVEKGIDTTIPNVIVAENSKALFFGILHEFWGEKTEKGKIGQGTVISSNAVIDPSVSIGDNCSIEGNVNIGRGTVIEHNVVISGNVRIGENCYIQSGTVIGIAGFGWTTDPDTGRHTMVDHFGGVEIGNDVFIGAHVNIARGTIDDTIISDGVKIAPSTHIGHNNFIGENTIAICSKFFGSATTGANSYVVDSTVKNQSRVGNHTVVGMGSVVIDPIPDDVIAYGVPAKPVKNNDYNY